MQYSSTDQKIGRSKNVLMEREIKKECFDGPTNETGHSE